MNPSDYQNWLIYRGADIVADGQPGQLTRDATELVFTNTNAPAVTDEDIQVLAYGLDCSFEQMSAVSIVESGGSGYDSQGRPKILYERHKFHGFTSGKWSVCSYSNPQSGGYSESSWDKLCAGLCKDVDSAFKSCSWGKFQVMGYWFPNLGYNSVLEMAYATVLTEAAHYDLFAGYIKMANLQSALHQVSTDPEDCRAFAKGYNGPAYEDYDYHIKIANEMIRLS